MNPSNVKSSETITGRIAYLSDRVNDSGRSRGVEDFTISTFGDGSMTLRASCVIDDPPHVVRDVIQTVDSAMRVVDCYVRVRTGNEFTGSGWFRWGDKAVECESFTATDGRLSERISCGPGPAVFCNHAIVGDAWMTAAYPLSTGHGLALVHNAYTPSRHKQGATGPTLNRLLLGLMWQGVETITVPAGRFEAQKFKLNSLEREADLSPENLAYEIWVLADGSHVPALSMYRGERRYELVAYTRS